MADSNRPSSPGSSDTPKPRGINEANALVQAAQDGSEPALAAVVDMVQDDIYRLSLKMLWSPEDAADAAQEILIRIITRLGSFRGDSHFRTWAHRVAVNYLFDYRKSLADKDRPTFGDFGQDLAEGLADPASLDLNEAELKLMVEDVKLGCTQGMLLCLDRDHRLAYSLGEVLQFNSQQGGYILDITPEAFRKRLSRARADIRSFMNGHCGLVNPNNRCRCKLRLKAAVAKGRVRIGQPTHAGLARQDDGQTPTPTLTPTPTPTPTSTHEAKTEAWQDRQGRPDTQDMQEKVNALEELDSRVAQLHRQPRYAAPKQILGRIKELVAKGKFPLDS